MNLNFGVLVENVYLSWSPNRLGLCQVRVKYSYKQDSLDYPVLFYRPDQKAAKKANTKPPEDPVVTTILSRGTLT